MLLFTSKDAAVRCVVRADARGAAAVTWSAHWESVPFALVEPIRALLDEVGAFGRPSALVEDSPDGDYLSVCDLTGTVGDRPFHISVTFGCPGEVWSPLGQRLRDALMDLRLRNAR